MMRYRQIPKTDLRVSALCLGTAQLGLGREESEWFRILDLFVENGGNFLDTARVYAAWVPGGMGLSEKTLGTWLKARGLHDEVVIGTKGAHPNLSTMLVPRMGRSDVVSDCEDSLRALGIDTIPLYWLHRDDEARPVEDILETMEALVEAGKIRWYGVSNWRAPRMQAAVEAARRHGLRGFVANQPLWSLAQVNPESISDPTTVFMDEAALQFHKTTQMTVIPYTSQARGFFSKASRGGIDSLSEGHLRAYDNAVNRERLNRVQHLAKETGWSVAAVVLAYLTSQPDFVTIPVIGASDEHQLMESMGASDLELSPDLVAYLAGASA